MSQLTLTRHPDAIVFLHRTQTALLAHEAANNLMLGIALRLQKHPERTEQMPFLTTVEDGGELAAAALMTPPYNIVVYAESAADPAIWPLVIGDLRQEQWPVPGVLGPSEAAEAFARAWAAITGQPYRPGMSERIYELRQVIPPRPPGGHMRLATEADRELATAWALAFIRETGVHDPPEQAANMVKTKIADRQLYLWEADGNPVSMAGATRPGVHSISIGPVYTPPEQRRRGYATACVAGLSQRLLDSGYEFCTLFTDLANPTSNSIYQLIGYRPVCDFNEYLFA